MFAHLQSTVPQCRNTKHLHLRLPWDSCLCLQLHYELDEDGDVLPGGGDALAKRPSVPTYLAVRP